MSTNLRRFRNPITPERLPEILSEDDATLSEPLEIYAEFGPLNDVLQHLRSQTQNPTSLERAAWDRELVEPLHTALRSLPKREASDMRVWHWLCVVELSDLVWFRWHGSVPEHPASDVFTPALHGRFLGTRSLKGISRNALARLWWCGETLYTPEEGYSLAQQALEDQDLFQNIFERQYGLYQPAARAYLRTLGDASRAEHRDAARRLDHYFTTISVETLNESDIVALISE